MGISKTTKALLRNQSATDKTNISRNRKQRKHYFEIKSQPTKTTNNEIEKQLKHYYEIKAQPTETLTTNNKIERNETIVTKSNRIGQNQLITKSKTTKPILRKLKRTNIEIEKNENI